MCYKGNPPLYTVIKLRLLSKGVLVFVPLLILPGAQMEARVQPRLGLGRQRLTAHDAGRRKRGVVACHVAQERLLRQQARAAAGARVARHHLGVNSG